MTAPLTGACKCGRCRYSGTPAEARAFRCYCRDCQQLTGSGHAELFPFDAGTFTITGTPTEYRMTGDAGRDTWSSFCPDCGSPLTRRSAVMPQRIYTYAGSLDDPAQHQPEAALFEDSAQPWDKP